MNRQTLFDLLICAAEDIILFYFADKILERRFKNHIILILSCMLHICTVYMINSAPLTVKIPLSIIVFFILSILNFSNRTDIIIGTVAYAFYIIIASEFIFADLVSLIQNTDIYNTVASYDHSTVFFAVAIKIINFLLYYFSIKNFKKINKSSRTFGIITLDIIFICFLLISSVLVILYPTVSYDPQQMTLFFVLSMIFFITSFLILDLYVKLCDYFEKERYWAVNDIKYRSLKDQIELQQEFVEESNKFRHDIKKILNTINYLFVQKQYPALEEYLNEISDKFYPSKNISFCNDKFIDPIINFKLGECKTQNIVLELDISDRIETPLEANDSILIIANLLDNAIEAVKKLESEDRKISFGLYNYEKNLVIYTKNPYIEDKNRSDFFSTSKQDSRFHGYGIKIIKDITEKYNGQISIEHDGGIFEVIIMLPI